MTRHRPPTILLHTTHLYRWTFMPTRRSGVYIVNSLLSRKRYHLGGWQSGGRTSEIDALSGDDLSVNRGEFPWTRWMSVPLFSAGFEVAAFYLRPARQFLVGTCIGESWAWEKKREEGRTRRWDSGEKKDGEARHAARVSERREERDR